MPSARFFGAARSRSHTVLVAAFAASNGRNTRIENRHNEAHLLLSTASSPIRQRWNHHKQLQKRPFSILMMTAADADDESEESTKTVDSEWDIKGLKQEVNRLSMRSYKKIGKASTRVQKAQELVEKLTADENATLEQLEACPNLDALELELQELQTGLRGLNQLGEELAAVGGPKKQVLPQELAQLALDLGVNDQPPVRQPRGPKKVKGPRSKNPPKTRLPYRKFYTQDKTEIRVGKQAEDNDELSLRPEHRDGSDWWMHASGCPGSHVVLRCSDENMDEEVVQDAAALAARQSKCSGNTIKVSMTRCRDVQKPRGAKAGLVQLTGRVRTITVNMKEAQKRLERLDSTVVIN
ncbi:Domain of unknown function (DUF814) [Seminavis robusta]|uniref:NFACT RNA-binding domain-containing protein n=1 Tax=Seminavis robusta TaxID=568900 RepID=A0A9N8DGR9_9STRA|nr:Domain of unknown function (DUF814) [Seminavis robusta]|eukprot:Sro137_g064390.1 Domain of unknown function (DUF814) (353) ;mRNA; f:60985-62154